MAITLTLTVSDADAQRISAVATASGFTTPKAFVVSLIQQAVETYEQLHDPAPPPAIT